MIENKIAEYFCNLHDHKCNQKYAGSLPYSFHLKMVNKQSEKFSSIIKPGMDIVAQTAVIIGLWGHDSIEDARLTYNDIVGLNKTLQLQHVGFLGVLQAVDACRLAADIIYSCTELRGKNRNERHGKEFFETLITEPYGVYVKLCDLMANIKYSLLENSSMFNKYKEEWPVFKSYIVPQYGNKYNPMISYIDKLLTIE